MPLQLPTRGDVLRYRRRYSLDGVTITLRLAWRQRSGAWYVDVLDGRDEPIVVGQRLSPSAPLAPDATAPGLPPGQLWVTGPDRYGREQLGTDVQIVYLTAAELAGG